ncbi:MAG: hypothetical protein JWR10_2419 [Rubritepida sp.]|nr:hypothetical protein [Rubritepida sp.]
MPALLRGPLSSLLLASALALAAPLAAKAQAKPSSSTTDTAPAQLHAKVLMDLDVYSSDNVEIGEVEDLVVDRQGRIIDVVIETDHRLGSLAAYISVPFTQLRLEERRAVLPMTRAKIRAMPALQDISPTRRDRPAPAR